MAADHRTLCDKHLGSNEADGNVGGVERTPGVRATFTANSRLAGSCKRHEGRPKEQQGVFFCFNPDANFISQ